MTFDAEIHDPKGSREMYQNSWCYHSTGNLYSQSITFLELNSICSYSSGNFLNYLFIQLQFLSLGGLFSYTGRPFTGTRPPFTQLLPFLLSHCVPSEFLGAERTKSRKTQHFGCRAKSLDKNFTFGRASKIPGKTALLGAGANKIPGKADFLGAEQTTSLEKQTKSLG